MTQQQLSRTQFPLGALRKTETRAIAEKNGLINADKPDSQDICFVPDGDYAKIIELHTGKKAQPGKFVDLQGYVLGTHRGIIHYTIGQRRGLGLAMGEPCYVCRIRPEDNTVVIGRNEDLFEDTVHAAEFNWISGTAPEGTIRCRAKIRYRQPEQPAAAAVQPDGTVTVVFDRKQRAITPGQAVVLYDGDTVLGGGVIQSE